MSRVPAVPIETIHLFPKLDQKLIGLLRSLQPGDWDKPTLAKLWTVKDIAAHLLDTNIRGISFFRDNYFGDRPGQISSYQDLVDYLNRLNADWVKAMKRTSPEVLIELLESTGKTYCEALAALNPTAPALFSVAWAGQEESPNWFHIAREYTEKWHHQQQIREAVDMQGIMTREFFFPMIDTFMQALPHTYRNTHAPHGSAVRITVSTEVGGSWNLVRHNPIWELGNEVQDLKTEISIDPDTAWKLFTKGMSAADAKKEIQITGDSSLGKPILSMLAVMA